MATKPTLAQRGGGISEEELQREMDKPKSHAQSAPARLGEFREIATEYEDKIIALKNELKEAVRGAKKAPINRLHKVPGRQRILTPEAKAELLENMRNNPMIEPITVERRQDGDWDIVSGSNRYDNCIILGRDEVEIFEIEIEAGKGDVIAFYANLIKSTLPDFEKYQGFKKRIDDTGMSIRQMATESGINENSLSNIMQFGRLPQKALDAIKSNPSCIGVNSVREFVKLVEAGRADQVCVSIISLASGIIKTQEIAVKMAALDEIRMAMKKPPAVSNVFKIGRAMFAEVRGIDKSIRISCETEEDRTELQGKIEALINAHILEKKSEK